MRGRARGRARDPARRSRTSSLGGRLAADARVGGRLARWPRRRRPTGAPAGRARPAATCVFGAYEHGVFGALSGSSSTAGASAAAGRAHGCWHRGARRGCSPPAHRAADRLPRQRPCPGVMLAGAARAYLQPLGVAAGPPRGALHQQRRRLANGGSRSRRGRSRCAAIVDRRPDSRRALPREPGRSASPVRRRHRDQRAPWAARGRRAAQPAAGRAGRRPICLAISGGWNPERRLACHLGAPAGVETRLWRPSCRGATPPGEVVGAANRRTAAARLSHRRREAAPTARRDELGFTASGPHELPRRGRAHRASRRSGDVRGGGQGLRRPAERRHRRGHRLARARASLGRAPEALHHARHGDRPGSSRRPRGSSPSSPSARPGAIPRSAPPASARPLSRFRSRRWPAREVRGISAEAPHAAA